MRTGSSVKPKRHSFSWKTSKQGITANQRRAFLLRFLNNFYSYQETKKTMVNITIYILYLNLSPPSVFRIENLGMFWSGALFSSARGLGAAGGYPHCFWVKAGLQHALIAVLFCFLFFLQDHIERHWTIHIHTYCQIVEGSQGGPMQTRCRHM